MFFFTRLVFYILKKTNGGLLSLLIKGNIFEVIYSKNKTISDLLKTLTPPKVFKYTFNQRLMMVIYTFNMIYSYYSNVFHLKRFFFINSIHIFTF